MPKNIIDKIAFKIFCSIRAINHRRKLRKKGMTLTLKKLRLED